MDEIIQEMEEKIASLEDGEEKLGYMVGVIGKYFASYPAKAAEAADRAHAYAVKLNNPLGIARAILGKGNCLMQTATFEEALPVLVEAKALLKELGGSATRFESTATNNIASIYSSWGNYELALEYYHESLELARQSGYIAMQAMSLFKLGLTYYKLDDAARALEFIDEGLHFSREHNDRENITQGLVYKGITLWHLLRSRDEAVLALEEALAIARQIPDPRYIAMSLNNLAEIYMAEQMYEEAIARFDESLSISRPTGMKQFLVNPLISLGKIYMELSRFDEALAYLQDAYSNIPESSIPQLYTAHEVLSACYKGMGNYAMALEHHEKFYRLKDEVFNEESQKKTKILTVQFEVEKTKSEKERAEKEREIVRLKNEELSAALEEVQALNARLVEMNTEKNEMLGIVAHDLKSPLAGIRMVSSLLKQHYQRMSGDELSRQLGDVEQTSDRILQIVNNLLNVHAIESDTVYTAEERMNISAEVGLIAQRYMAEADRKGIALRLECDKPLWLQGSRDALQQAVENLVSNALKFSPAGKNIWLRVRRSDGSIQIEVEDEGPGIKAEDQEKMFEKYGRLSARPTGGEGSTGLGLWIVRKSVDVLRGSIHCHSEVGRGTTFIVELPAAIPAV